MNLLRRVVVWAAVAVVTTATLHAQPIIEHSGLNCMRPGEFVVVLSGIDPGDDVQTAKVYFRSSLYRDYYYVEMAYQEGRYVGILPEPSSETREVIYYLEALDSSFNTARSLEYDADVRDGCRQEPAAAYLSGAAPAITVGATSFGAATIPPGFTAAGIVGTVTAAGVASGVGGGIGAGTAVAAGAAVVAGAGAGVLVVGNDDAVTTSSILAIVPTTSTAATTTIPASTTSSTTGSNPGPSTTTIPGAPTTTVPGGSTTTVPGGSTTTVPGSSTTTSLAPGLDASCFTVDVLAACSVRVDATCVALPVDQYEWTLDLNDRWQKVEFLDGPASLSYTWSAEDCGADDSLRFKLKVRRGAGASTVEKNFFVPGDNASQAPPGGSVRFTVNTRIDVPGRMRGRILVNDAPIRVVDNTAPSALRLTGRRGTNKLSAVVVTASGEPGTWRFALDPIVPGSLDVIAGNVVTREPNAVVFRLSGHVGERIELEFIPRE